MCHHSNLGEVYYLLRKIGQFVELCFLNKNKMPLVRLNAAEHFFQEIDRGASVAEYAVYSESKWTWTTYQRYYAGISFQSNFSNSLALNGNILTTIDATHFYNKSAQICSTSIKYITYDTNVHFLPLLFALFSGAESHEYWKKIIFSLQKN